jgi:hypothetical protein
MSGVFLKGFVLGGLVCLPVFFVLAGFLGMNGEVAFLLAVALTVVVLVVVPEMLKQLRRSG